MMVLRLNTLMVLAVAADECMCQLFPVRGGDGQLKFAANDDGSCIAEKLFRAPRLEAGEVVPRHRTRLERRETLDLELDQRGAYLPEAAAGGACGC